MANQNPDPDENNDASPFGDDGEMASASGRIGERVGHRISGAIPNETYRPIRETPPPDEGRARRAKVQPEKTDGEAMVSIVGTKIGAKIGRRTVNQPARENAATSTPVGSVARSSGAARRSLAPALAPLPRSVKCPNCAEGRAVNPNAASGVMQKNQYDCNSCNTYVVYHDDNPADSRWYCPSHQKYFNPGERCDHDARALALAAGLPVVEDTLPDYSPGGSGKSGGAAASAATGGAAASAATGGAAASAATSATARGVNKGRRSPLERMRDARTRASRASRVARDPLGAAGDKAYNATVGAAKTKAQLAILGGMNRLGNKVIGKIPIVGSFFRKKGGGDVAIGISKIASNPIFSFVLDRIPGVPKTGTMRIIPECGCGVAACCGNCTGCGGCSCGAAGGGCLLPAFIVLIVVIFLGSQVSSQPGFVSSEFCAQYDIKDCSANGDALVGEPTDISAQQLLAYQTVEAATGVPWFYIAAWEKVSTDYGVAPAAQKAASKAPTSAQTVAKNALEALIAQEYPDLSNGTVAQPPSLGQADASSPTPSASTSAPPVVNSCELAPFQQGLVQAFAQPFFTLTIPAPADKSTGKQIQIYESPSSFETISYNADGTIGVEHISMDTASWTRQGDSGDWTADAVPTIPMDTQNLYADYTNAQIGQIVGPNAGECAYFDSNNNLLLRLNAAGVPIDRGLGVGTSWVSASYDYTTPVAIYTPTNGTPIAPSPAPSGSPVTTVGPPSPSPNASNVGATQLASDQAAAEALRAALASEIANLQSNLRGGSFGPYLINGSEWGAYGKSNSKTPLNPYDEQDGGTIIAEHMVDVYTNSMQYTGPVITFPGTPIAATLDSKVSDWIDTQMGNATTLAYLASLVTPAIEALYTGKIGLSGGPTDTWSMGPVQGRQVTTAERYYICNKLASGAASPAPGAATPSPAPSGTATGCDAFSVNANTLTISPNPSDPKAFADEIGKFYDPSKPIGSQVLDYGALQVLMGALLSQPDIWGMESGALFSVQNVTAGGQVVGQTSEVNAYAKAISSYAISLYTNWVISRTGNNANGLDAIEFAYWGPALNAAAAAYDITWPYIAATAHADNLFACVSNYPNNIEPAEVAAEISSGSGGAPPPSSYYTGIGAYAGDYLVASNPTGLNDCWRAGAGTVSDWTHVVSVSSASSASSGGASPSPSSGVANPSSGASSTPAISDSRPQAATNYCGFLTATISFNDLNGFNNNCGSVIISALGPDGTLHSETIPVTGFCDCFTGVTSVANAIETTSSTEDVVALNDAAISALGYTPAAWAALSAPEVIMYPQAPANPASWPAGMIGLAPLSDSAAISLLNNPPDASSSNNPTDASSAGGIDPVRQEVMNKMVAKLQASLGKVMGLSSTAVASPSPLASSAPSFGASSAPSSASSGAAGGASASASGPYAAANMVTWWAAWQDYSGCVLGTEIVNITDPITGVVLGTSGTCTFIATADQWVRYYLQRTSSGANYTPPFVTEAAPDLMIDGHYWDCTYASAIMLINKITYGALDVSTQTQVRNIIYYWRNTMGNPPGTATNAAKYIWPGADQIYKIEFGKGVTSWSQLLTWLDDGNGAELMGYYSAWNKNSPWSQYPADVGDTPFANETSSASGHAIYLDHRDAATGQIFVMDPLGHGSYAGEYLPDAAVEAFATTVDPIAGSSMGTPASLYVYLGEDTVPGWTIPADQKNPYWTPPGQLVGAPGSYATPSVDEAKTYLLDQLGDREAACASRIFQQESSWRPTAANPASDIPTGAYGIPQAKPKTKLGTWAAQMAASATGGGDYTSAAAYEDWELNPVVQVQWGIGYMNNRYGSACTAAAFKFGGVGDNGVTYPGTGWY